MHHPNDEQKIRDMIEKCMNTNPTLQTLKNLTGIAPSIRTINDDARAIYHIPDRMIYINGDNDFNDEELEETLLHEYVHAYDHIIRHINLSSIEGLAESEIHAAKMAETRHLWFPKKHVKEIASTSVSISTGDIDEATNIVESVFDQAYNDDTFREIFGLTSDTQENPYLDDPYL